LVLVASLTGGMPVSLSGPGIEVARQIAPRDLHSTFWPDAQRNSSLYPRGVDLMLMDDTHLIGLPRSTQIAFTQITGGR
jgi:alpha-D-ribose 1-methylphosphonate 5-triphosphate synthase subunit PhnH